jgi:hypothetical protein
VQQTLTVVSGALADRFGVSAIALAVGGGLGNLVGNALCGASTTNGMPAVPWLHHRRCRRNLDSGVVAVESAIAGMWNIPCPSGVISVERHTTPEVQQWNWYCRLSSLSSSSPARERVAQAAAAIWASSW